MCQMKVYKRVFEVIDGVEREFVMIDIEDFNSYMFLNHTSFSKLQTRKEQFLKREERQQEAENKRIEEIKEKERREQEKEDKYKQKIEKEIMVNKHENERNNKIKEELKTEYKEVFESNEDATVKKCGFCQNHKVYPLHFFNDENKKYVKEYIKDKQLVKKPCCVDCYLDAEEKKKTRITECTMHCNVCKSSYIAFGEIAIIEHNNSMKHKKNLQATKTTTNIKLELLSVKELHSICSKSTTEQGTYLINNYSKVKKEELVKKMYEVYDKLTLDFY